MTPPTASGSSWPTWTWPTGWPLPRPPQHHPPDDLRQTARVALIGAADRYDPTCGTPFRPYAITGILGELKRHLCDTTWSLRVPRTIKQHTLTLLGVRERLTQRGDRWPAIAELATKDLSG